MTEAERAGHQNGFVGYDKNNNFVHFCACGREASFGHEVSLLKGQLGTWFCSEHNPEPPASKIQDHEAVPLNHTGGRSALPLVDQMTLAEVQAELRNGISTSDRTPEEWNRRKALWARVDASVRA